MKISDLKCEYDRLQELYGAKELTSIYNGGCEENPDIFFVFMNPTGRNIASSKDWVGRKSPWLGTKNIWKLFYKLNLINKEIYDDIQNKKPNEWDYEFSDIVYDNITTHKCFISNLGKCTQIDARHIPDSVYKEYLYLLEKEIEIIKPKIIVTFGNQVSSIFLNQNINVSQYRKKYINKNISGIEYKVYPVYYPIGNGMRNIDKTIEDLYSIIKEI